MTTKTKVYVLLVALGLAALGLDRCYYGVTAPETIEAGEIDADVVAQGDDEKPAPPRVPALRKPVTAAAPGVPQLHFPRNLPAFDPAREMRDIFARNEQDNPNNRTGSPAKAPSSKNSPPEAIGREAFQANHRIDALMIQESLKIAVVDGRWVREGDNVDGCKLVRIEGDFAVFQCHDGDTILSPAGRRLRRRD